MLLMKKIKLEPGKRYKGYAVLNEYGEINFTPEQTGSRPDLKKIVIATEDYTIYETKKFLIASLRVDRSLSFQSRVQNLLGIFNLVLSQFYKYDF